MVDEIDNQDKEKKSTVDFVPHETHEIDEEEVSLEGIGHQDDSWSFSEPEKTESVQTEPDNDNTIQEESPTTSEVETLSTSEELPEVNQLSEESDQPSVKEEEHQDHFEPAFSAEHLDHVVDLNRHDDAKEPFAVKAKHFLTENWFYVLGVVLVFFLGKTFLSYYGLVKPSAPSVAVSGPVAFQQPDKTLATAAPPAVATNPLPTAQTEVQQTMSQQQAPSMAGGGAATPIQNDAPVTPPASPASTSPTAEQVVVKPEGVTDEDIKKIINDNTAATKAGPKNGQMQDLGEDVNSITMMQMAVPIAKNISSIQNHERQTDGKIEQISKSMKEIGTNIKSLQAQFAQLSSAAKQITALNRKLDDVKTIVVKEDLLLAKKPETKLEWPLGHLPGTMSYSVMAVIPGQAWLKDNHNKLITVQTGTSLGPFGLVAKIDPINHAIITTSGQVFFQTSS